MLYLEAPTPLSLCHFTPVETRDVMVLGQGARASPEPPCFLSPTNLHYRPASPSIEHLDFSDFSLDMLDLSTPRLPIDSPPRFQSAEPQMAFITRTPSPASLVIRLDNLPWFKFQVLYRDFLKMQGSMKLNLNKNTSSPFNVGIVISGDSVTDIRPSLHHSTNYLGRDSRVSIMDALQVSHSIPEETANLRYLLDLRGAQQTRDTAVVNG